MKNLRLVRERRVGEVAPTELEPVMIDEGPQLYAPPLQSTKDAHEHARTLLRRRSLRVTRSRVAVLARLLTSQAPMSSVEIRRVLGADRQDRATVHRNLRSLTTARLTQIVRGSDGVARYLVTADGAHGHPHFVCDACGQVCCLPSLRTAGGNDLDAPWRTAVREASVQIRGSCPECVTKAAV